MTLTQRVEELTISSANESKRNIGAFILRKKGRLREYNTQRIAAETYTSKAALVRFAKSLGFSGWTEFSREYVREQRYQETRYSEIDPNVPFRDDSSTQDIIQQMCSLEMESLMDTADLLAPQTVDRIVDLMKRSGRIALFGMSPNNLLGELFRRRMLTVGRMIEVPALGDSGLLASIYSAIDFCITGKGGR